MEEGLVKSTPWCQHVYFQLTLNFCPSSTNSFEPFVLSFVLRLYSFCTPYTYTLHHSKPKFTLKFDRTLSLILNARVFYFLSGRLWASTPGFPWTPGNSHEVLGLHVYDFMNILFYVFNLTEKMGPPDTIWLWPKAFPHLTHYSPFKSQKISANMETLFL